jgi:TRAP-type C4-dicarboxylate transport system substrate-binding protein
MIDKTARILAATAALTVAVFTFQPAFAEPFSLRISGENPIAGLDMQMAQRFGENLEAALGDDFSHEFFHTQALGDEVVHMQMVRSGQIDVYPLGSDAVQLDPNGPCSTCRS